MKRKMLALVLAMAMTATGLAGCGGGSSSAEMGKTGSSGTGSQGSEASEPEASVSGSEEAAGSDTADGGEVEIQFLHGQPEEERVQAIQEIIDAFEAENPGIKVTQMPIPEDGFWTKISAMIGTGELPAVVENGVDMLRLLNAEEALDLEAATEVIETVGKDRYYGGVLDMMKAP